MKSRIQQLFDRRMTRKGFIKGGFLLFVSSFALYGVIEQLLSNAATPSGSTEADSGSRTGDATVVANTATPDDKAVEFGAVGATATGTGSSTTSSSTSVPSGPTGNFKLAWHDEFDDSAGSSGPTNGLLKTKWNIGNNVGPSAPGQPGVQGSVSWGPNADDGDYHGPGTVKLPGDGSLHLQGIAYETAPDSPPGLPYTTYDAGEVTTAGLMALNPASTAITDSTLSAAISDGSVTLINGPCVFEVRMRLQGPNQTNANLWWPVIWMSNGGNFQGGSGTAWPGGVSYLVEQDYWEWYYSPNGTVGGANNQYEGGTFSMPIQNFSGVQAMPDQYADTDMSLEYHTYTVAFTSADSLTLYVDGIIPPGWPLTNSTVAENQQYPFFLIIALQSHQMNRSLPDDPAYGTVTSNPPNTTAAGNNDMMIDYVRVWNLT
jgi:hypothetical protein